MRARFLGPAVLALTLALQACGGGGGGGSTTPATPTPTPTPTQSPGTEAAFTCPTSVSTLSLGTQSSGFATSSHRRRAAVSKEEPAASNTLLAVTYSSGVRASVTPALDGKVRSFGGTMVHELTFDKLGHSVRVFSVSPAARAGIASSLRATPGVLDVSPVQRRYASATSPFITNDPFFGGNGVPQLYQASMSAGQWDMHVEFLEHAFDYSRTGNPSGIVNAKALGSTGVRLAIVDTGVDVTHPDLANTDIVRTQCYLTDTSGHLSTGAFVTDPDGHGTNVAGIAGADVNNGLGFSGDAGNVALMFYRVFPTPDSNCSKATTTDPQCSAGSSDIAAAINDAVSTGANVISLSFGGSNCVSGQDPDSIEGQAIANAIAHNVIVTAAAGNAGGAGVGAPACDPGVIAVGATGYNDGNPNGTGYTGPNTEYVTSYTQFGSTNTPHNANSWGIVAPGGDGASDTDQDNLHWITNLWTSTPWSTSDRGICGTDPFGEGNYCYILIDGTSQATPHVGGAAALILSVNPSYANPAAMKALLCNTADDIKDAHQGCGRLNVYRAMAIALHDPSPP